MPPLFFGEHKKMARILSLSTGNKIILFVILFSLASLNYIIFSFLDTYDYDFLATNDSGAFQRIGFNLANGKGFSVAINEPFEFCPVRPALYPVFLAMIFKLSSGPCLNLAKAGQAIFYLAMVILLYISTYKAYPRKEKVIFFWTGILICLFPHLAAASTVLLSESLTLFF